MDKLDDMQKGILVEFFTEAIEEADSMLELCNDFIAGSEGTDILDELLMKIDVILAGSSMLGLEDIKRLSRTITDLVYKLQDNSLKADDEVKEILLMAVETLRDIISRQQAGESADFDLEEIITSISFFTDDESYQQMQMQIQMEAAGSTTGQKVKKSIKPEEELVEPVDDEEEEEEDEEDLLDDLQAEALEMLAEEPEHEEFSAEMNLDIFAKAVSQHLKTVQVCIETLQQGEDKGAINALIRGLQGIKGASLFISHTEMELRAEVLLEEMARSDLFGKDHERKNSLFAEMIEFVEGIQQFLYDNQQNGEEEEMPAIEAVAPQSHTAFEAKPDTSSDSKTTPHFGDSLKVNINKIDRLMNSVGELISLNTKLINIKNIVESDVGLNGSGKNIGKITAFLDKLTEQLYNQMLSIRMMPVRSLFNKFKSVIETLSVEQQKKIEVNIKGERTEIDRVVLESLRDPLIHLIRNAVDHGVESPEVRISKGKPAEGKVNLRAFNDVNSVVIEIEDDGKGMDADRILSKAIEKGLVDPMEAGNLSKREIFQIIFAPGFSTAEQVTSLSGRGVGMDVVRTTVERHGGNIVIQTEKGKGSCFKIRLPLAMSMVDTLIVRSGGAIFAIPSEGIVRILKTPKAAFKTIFEKSVLPLNGNTIPFRRLSSIFDEYCEDDPTKSYVLTAIIKSENRPLALGLDEIIGKQKVVIKNIGKFLGNVKGISGAYIQGDGKIILVINIRDVCNVKVQDAF